VSQFNRVHFNVLRFFFFLHRLFEKATCHLCFTLLSGKLVKLKWQLHLRLCDYLVLTSPVQPRALARQHKGVGDPQVVRVRCVLLSWPWLCGWTLESFRGWEGGGDGPEVRRQRSGRFFIPDRHSNPRKPVK